MRYPKLPLRRVIPGAGAVLGIAAAGVLFVVPANAGTTVSFGEGVLSVVGDGARNAFVVGSTTAGIVTLNGSAVLGGTVSLSAVTVVHLEGGGGDDILRLDEGNNPMPAGDFLGGDGNDKLDGGSAADHLVGGPGLDGILGKGGDDTIVGDDGNDKIIGGTGVDTVSMGAGGDEFTWNPGDGSDHVDGDADKDTLLFNAGPEELVQLFPKDLRAILFLPPDPFDPAGTPPRLELSVSGFELMKVNIADLRTRAVRINDMAGLDWMVVRVTFAPYTGPDAAFDTILYRGTVGPDSIRLAGTPAAGLTVFGGAEGVLCAHADRLTVFGGDGDDVIDANLLAAGTVRLEEHGGGNPFIEGNQTDGDDTLIGTPGDDILSGGTGFNHIDGRGGNDIITGNS